MYPLVIPYLAFLCICPTIAKDDDPVLSEFKKFEKVYETSQNVLFNPDQVVDVNDPGSLNYLADLQRRVAITENENGDVYSVAESFEYILDHFKRAKIFEEKLDQNLKSFNILAEEEEFYQKMLDTQELLAVFRKRAKDLLKSMKQRDSGKTGTEFQKEYVKLTKEFRDFEQLYANQWISLRSKLTSNDQFLEMNQRIDEMSEEMAKFSAMSDLQFARHLGGVQKSIGTSDADLISIGFDKKLDVDFNLLESLLKLHQKLEGMKNQVLIEKDVKTKMQSDDEIKDLEENKIPDFLHEKRDHLKIVMAGGLGSGFRCVKKMNQFEELVHNVGVMQNKHKALNEKWRVGVLEINAVFTDAKKLMERMLRDEF